MYDLKCINKYFKTQWKLFYNKIIVVFRNLYILLVFIMNFLYANLFRKKKNNKYTTRNKLYYSHVTDNFDGSRLFVDKWEIFVPRELPNDRAMPITDDTTN